jgi:serine/threonine protein kinase
MLCCLNPDCDRPINPDNLNFCQNCGTPLIALLRSRFKVMEPIGRGGFGKTYLAEDTDKLNEHCIVKQLVHQGEGTWAAKKAAELFKQEAQQLQQLGEHPQIPTLLAYFEEGKFLYLVQQFIQGQNLLGELKQKGSFSDAQILQLLNDLLPVLQFIHARGVIHRDIKPENIMRQFKDDRLILIDFGVAKLISQTVIGTGGAIGTILGSQGYAPMEQIKEGKALYASDLYALGVTCFHLLSGKNPYELWTNDGFGWAASWRQHVTTTVSPQLELVLDRLLKKNAGERYQTASEVLQDLQPPAIANPPSNPPSDPLLPTPPVIAPTVAVSTPPPATYPPVSTPLQAPPTNIIPPSRPGERESNYQQTQQFQQFAEPPKQSKPNFATLVSVGVAAAIAAVVATNFSGIRLWAQKLIAPTATSSSSPTTSSPITSTPPETPTTPTTTTSNPTAEAKSLVKASTTPTGVSSPDRFLQVKADNLQTYSHKNGLFELNIPEGWTPTDNSKTGETIVLWFDPTKNALITVDIFNAPEGFDNTKMIELLKNFLKNTFGTKPGFFMEDPITQSDGSVQIVWGYLETIQGATDRVQGNSFIQTIDNKVSLLTVGVLNQQFDSLREPMTRVINSYKVNASVQL